MGEIVEFDTTLRAVREWRRMGQRLAEAERAERFYGSRLEGATTGQQRRESRAKLDAAEREHAEAVEGMQSALVALGILAEKDPRLAEIVQLRELHRLGWGPLASVMGLSSSYCERLYHQGVRALRDLGAVDRAAAVAVERPEEAKRLASLAVGTLDDGIRTRTAVDMGISHI